jgi:hypothetical protein
MNPQFFPSQVSILTPKFQIFILCIKEMYNDEELLRQSGRDSFRQRKSSHFFKELFRNSNLIPNAFVKSTLTSVLLFGNVKKLFTFYDSLLDSPWFFLIL